MKITNVSCEQFAGIRDKSISFADGINVVFGENESGKSTLVNLISRVLFQDAKLNKTKDKTFLKNFMPAAKRGGHFKADSADGKVSFSCDGADFTLSKEWGDDPREKLSTPDGIIKNQTEIDEVLKKILVYTEGVYSEMLLFPQSSAAEKLKSLLSPERTPAKSEITEAVSAAFSESDGISAEAIEEAITHVISEIEGNHWDFAKGMPIPKAGSGRHKNGLGQILQAYYNLEDAETVLENIKNLENVAESAAKEYEAAEKQAEEAESECKSFERASSAIDIKNQSEKVVENIRTDVEKLTAVQKEWPVTQDEYRRAEELKKASETRALVDLYLSAKEKHDSLIELEEKIKAMPHPSEDEIRSVADAQEEIQGLEKLLCAMNIRAAVRMMGENTIEIKSVRTGEKIDASADTAITEAVIITVPGVMEMQLSPAEVNIEETQNKLSEKRKIIDEIFEKYNTESLKALENMASEYEKAVSKKEDVSSHLKDVLGARNYEELEMQAAPLTENVEEKSVIEALISELCAGITLDRFLGDRQGKLNGYTADYGTPDALLKKTEQRKAELAEEEKNMAELEDIPEEYSGIADPKAHLEELEDRSDKAKQRKDSAIEKKGRCNEALSSYTENLSDDPVEAKARAEHEFEEKKTLLAHWKNIKAAFEAQKEKFKDNPLTGLAESFSDYLSIITGGRVISELGDDGKLSPEISSSDYLIDFGKLSEGTKEAVSLAFRLAVLDHLFPDGGGIIVLDDPFANMDAVRTQRASEIIKKAAEKHQIIFMTCKEENISILGGNTIRL